MKLKPKTLVLDVDGVFTDGKFYYTAEGKVAKKFGPDDHDAILLLKKYMDVIAVTGDKKGFPITQKRIETDMKLPLSIVSTFERAAWIKEKYNLDETIYMGDGIFDAMVFNEVAYGIAPANAFYKVKEYADFVTQSKGGSGAVAEACWHIMEKFFEEPNVLKLKLEDGQGEWGKKK